MSWEVAWNFSIRKILLHSKLIQKKKKKGLLTAMGTLRTQIETRAVIREFTQNTEALQDSLAFRKQRELKSFQLRPRLHLA